MRNILFLIIFAEVLLCGLAANAKDRVISKPACKLSNSELELKTIIQTDTATVLCFRVNCIGRPWVLRSGVHLRANNKSYAYRHGKLVTKKDYQFIDSFFAPDSTNTTPYTKIGEKYFLEQDSLVLSFNKLPDDTQSFDFIEGDDRNDWKTFGIKMDGKPYLSSLPKLKKQSDTKLPTYTIKTGKAILKGKICDYDDAIMKNSISYFVNEYNLVGNQNDIKMHTDSLGNFSFEVELLHPTPFTFIMPGGYIKVILVPDEELELNIDVATRTANEIHRWSENPPKLEKELQFNGKYGPMNETLNDGAFYGYTVDFLKSLLTISFDEYVQQIWNDYHKTIKKIAENKEYDTQQRDFLNLKAQATYLYKRINYIKNINNGMYYSRIENNSSTISKYKEQFTLKDPHAQELNLYNTLNSLYVVYNYSPMEYLEANNLDKSELYQWMADLKKAKEVAGQINMMKVVKDSTIWNNIASQYVPTLQQHNELIIKKIEEIQNQQLKGTIREVPEVPGKDLIQTIIDSYKGKVVMIDCWATWCGPCKTGIAKMEPVKEELEGKEVVFVYLTNETSDIETWTKEVENLKGEHYRISKQKWDQLPGISAIPHYIIYDRQGNKVMEKVGWNGKLVNEFKEVILKALDKKE